jgi:alpha-maltose-1-phosphate synthase
MSSSIVINYHAGFSTSRERLMGANAAAEGFLRAYLKYSGEQEFHAIVHSQAEADAFTQTVREFAKPENAPVHVYPENASSKYGKIGCIYNEDPIFSQFAWWRRWDGITAYSLCGITHTTCTDTILDAFGELLTAPFYPWDALICTSQSVKNTVERVLESYSAYFAERLGATRRPAIELPVIPLGVDCDTMDRESQSPQNRKTWRSILGIGEQEIAFLFFGRLSYHGKANPYPMFRALEIAAQRTAKKLHLILAGWFANEVLEEHITSAAAKFCPSVKLHKIDGRRPEVRHQIWSAADIFTSLSDNIQETFGLTPVEAMSAGLPAVISDWNGYRDTVRHGKEGIRIPTSMSPPGTGEVFMRRHFLGVDNYDRYIGHVSHFNAVDISQTVEAYVALIQNPDLRKKFGAAGRRRAREVFDWRVIIAQYQALWRELANRRAAAAKQPHSAIPPHPLRPDPFRLFSDYPTAPFLPTTLIGLSPHTNPQLLETLYNEPILQYLSTPLLMPEPPELLQLLAALQTGPKPSDEVLKAFPVEKHESVIRGMLWLLKVGLLQRQFPSA